MYKYYQRPDEIYHYGIKRRSGRYPWGSGDRPYQRDKAGSENKIKYTSPSAHKAKGTALSIAINVPLRILSTIVPGFSSVANPIILMTKSRYLLVNKFDNTDYVKKEGPLEKVKDMKRLKETSDIKKSAAVVNPTGLSKKGRVNNCMNCTAAMEMRERGYDVISRSSGHGLTPDAWKNMFKNAEIKNPRVERENGESRKSFVERSFDNYCNTIEKQGEGARGSAMFFYDKISNSGHSVFYKVENGTVNFYDGQNNKINNTELFALADPNSYMFVRFDNLAINTDNIPSMVISNKKG